MVPGFDDPLYLDGLGAFLAGPANVVMQLALAPVGYGVLESKVDSGMVTLHPLKRFRTTFTRDGAARGEQDPVHIERYGRRSFTVHPAQSRRSSTPRTNAACPACCRSSEMTLTSRTPAVTGGSQRSSTTRSRSASRRPRR